MVNFCSCPWHPSNKDDPAALCRPVFKKKKKKIKIEANVNISARHWITVSSNGATFQSKVAAFCGQSGECSRLCSGCVSKWERQMKTKEPDNFVLYSQRKAGT